MRSASKMRHRVMDCGSLAATMDRNPYAPPAATVSDPVPAPLADRPYAVKRGVLLLWISFVLVLLEAGWSFHTEQQDMVTLAVGMLVVMVPSSAFCAFVIYKIWMRRHWARVAYLIVAIMGYSAMLYYSRAVLEDVRTDIIATLLNAAATITNIVGTVLIFTPAANRWFRDR
jgi:hypothetical protein